MHIRPFHPTDEPAVIALWQDCNLVVPWNDPHQDIARKLMVAPELFLVGVMDDHVIATLMAGYEGHRGWFNYLAVATAHQRRSHARALVEAAEERLAARGCPKINLQIRATNQCVIEFYRAIGYSVDDVISMGKRL